MPASIFVYKIPPSVDDHLYCDTIIMFEILNQQCIVIPSFLYFKFAAEGYLSLQ